MGKFDRFAFSAGADYDEAAALGNVAGGLEVERPGVDTRAAGQPHREAAALRSSGS